MQAFTDFALADHAAAEPDARARQLARPPRQQAGRDFFTGSRRADGVADRAANLGFNCNGCHTLDPSQGFFGTNGDASFENETADREDRAPAQPVPEGRHVRDAGVPFVNAGDNGLKGDQVRGFGFLHDGSIDTVFRFLKATVFNNDNGVGFDGPSNGDAKRRQIEQFMLAFDTDLAPIVGQQVTLTSTNAPSVGAAHRPPDPARRRRRSPRRSWAARSPSATLIVKGTVAGEARGWVRTRRRRSGATRPPRPTLSDAARCARSPPRPDRS